MRRHIIHTAVLLSCLLAGGGILNAADIRRVKALEFQGLRLLSKYDIIRGARMKADKQGIVIDVDSLRQALSKNHFIKTYGIGESGGALVISVAEKVPAHIVAVVQDGKTSVYELDSDHTIISKNDVHAPNLPIVYITGREGRFDAAQGSVKRLFTLLDRVRMYNAPIYREISEIYFHGDKLRIVLRGRRTDFILRPEENDFFKMRYVAGYLDRINRYPDEITMSDRAAIIR